MDRNGFGGDMTGSLVPTFGGRKAFVPAPLPPSELDLHRIATQLAAASEALGELRGIGRSVAPL